MSIKFEMVLEDLYKLTLSQRPIIRKNYNLLRIRRLLNELGNPQNKIQVIHIAGTSGKGSTSTILSTILTSQGFKTGLFISPHMISLNERIQINNLNISDEDFINVYEKVKTIIIKINKKEEQEVTFFEALTAMAFYHFAEQKVDYAVIETGLGGIVDPTNIVEDKDKIAIITKIGFDHTDILGKTLTLIAKQKAGIIHNKNVCISAAQKPQVTKVLESACQSTKSNFFQIGNQAKYSINKNNTFNYSFDGLTLKDIKLSLLGDYQKENCSLALTALIVLAEKHEFIIDIEGLKNALSKIVFLGRFSEFTINNNKIIIDGAHNPQKMSAFTKAIKNYYPNKKLNFVISFKKGKDYKRILKYILPIAKKIYISNFIINTQGFKIESESELKLLQILKGMGFFDVEIINPSKIYSLVNKINSDFIITGSLYFLAEQVNNHKLINNS